MTWLRAAIGVGVAAVIVAALASAGLKEETPATQLLEIPGIGVGGAAVVVDSLGREVGRLDARSAVPAARRWLRRARPLGAGAPPWARRMQRRSLLVLRALTDRDGAVIAGARDGWAYVWPRDAGAVALAYAAAGYRDEARRVARFLRGLDLDAAARFHPNGAPVEGRNAQGDALGWAEAGAQAAGVSGRREGENEFDYLYEGSSSVSTSWRDRADYQEKDAGDYLGNALASGVSSARIQRLFGIRQELQRRAGDPDAGIDSVVAWAVRPFPQPALFPLVRLSLRTLLNERESRFGIVPSEDWPEEDPWTAPTAWTAWALATLGDRPAALRLMGGLRRAATPLGLLPERVDAQTGEPRSTTPLAWSHAFAILALRELWP